MFLYISLHYILYIYIYTYIIIVNVVNEPVTDVCCHRVEGAISESIAFFLPTLTGWSGLDLHFYDVIEWIRRISSNIPSVFYFLNFKTKQTVKKPTSWQPKNSKIQHQQQPNISKTPYFPRLVRDPLVTASFEGLVPPAMVMLLIYGISKHGMIGDVGMRGWYMGHEKQHFDAWIYGDCYGDLFGSWLVGQWFLSKEIVFKQC